MERAAVLMVLLSLHSGCHGSIGLPYDTPDQECKDTTIMKSSTILVTQTETRLPITTTRVIPAETEFKAMPPAWTTSVTKTLIQAPQSTVTSFIDGEPCREKIQLDPTTVTNPILIYHTKYIDPVTIFKPSKIIKWKTMKPITTTVVDTSTEIPDFKVKVIVKTTEVITQIPAAPIMMTMPITFTELIPAMTSTVTDRNVHTTHVPAHTNRIPADTIMKEPMTHTSTVIITHTTVVPADTKMQTWTVTQMINKECKETYLYNQPPVVFTHGLSLPGATAVAGL